MDALKPMQDPAFLVTAARLRLMQAAACGLLAEVGYSLEHIPDDTIPTLCTNGRTVRYSPAFIMQLSDADLETALLHEWAHVVLLHPLRLRPQHDPKKANEAMDFAANEWVQAAGRTIPKDWMLDPKYFGMAWEAIYTLRQQENTPPAPPPPEQPEPGNGDSDDEQHDDGEDGQNDENGPQDGDGDAEGDDTGDGQNDAKTDQPANANEDGDGEQDGEPADGDAPGTGKPQPGKPGDAGGNVEPFPGKDGEPATEQELSAAAADLTDRIARIAQAQQMAGTGSEGAARYLASMNTPRDPDLYEALAALLERSASDHSWRKPNRRLLHAGIFPGLDGEECPPLVVCIDTSGSINDEILAAFSDKVRRAVQDFRPRAITLIYCDSRINGTPETYAPDDLPELTPQGGGGTDFRPPFKWVAENMDEAPAALVYLTDLEGQAPDDAPPFPVIWAAIPSTWRTVPAFGDIVPLIL